MNCSYGTVACATSGTGTCDQFSETQSGCQLGGWNLNQGARGGFRPDRPGACRLKRLRAPLRLDRCCF